MKTFAPTPLQAKVLAAISGAERAAGDTGTMPIVTALDLCPAGQSSTGQGHSWGLAVDNPDVCSARGVI